jgi:DNA-binding NtrC family response regulator
MMAETILIVDDDRKIQKLLEVTLNAWEFNVLLADNGAKALETLDKKSVDLIVSDQNMPEMGGLELLVEVKRRSGESIPFVMLTAFGSIEKAVESLKKGAYDYIQKPFNPEDLSVVVKRALGYRRLQKQNRMLKDHLSDLYSFQNIVTRSPLMMKALGLAEKVAATPSTTVAIYGESGVGKEVLARAIHFASERLENRFVAVNCAGIPRSLLESELFGHVKGAFTGAEADREGKLGLALNGTILLDEIGDMQFELQSKLLRVLQERLYERVGSNRQIKADFRVIVSTHRELARLVEEGRFREDLYHRINTFPITVPPLRERVEDIPLLANHFLDILRNELGKKLPGFSQDAMEAMLEYHWPGNIREMKNAIERAAIVTDDELIRAKHLQLGGAHQATVRPERDSPGEIRFEVSLKEEDFSLQDVVDRVLDFALQRSQNNKSRAAKMLKVDRKLFYRRK